MVVAVLWHPLEAESVLAGRIGVAIDAIPFQVPDGPVMVASMFSLA